VTPPDSDSFARFIAGLTELEVTVGPKAGPVVAELRELMLKAAAARQSGQEQTALAAIAQAMGRITTLAELLDPTEALMMRAIAQRFTQALGQGDKATAKETVNVMRHRAGDPKDDPAKDW